MPTNVHLTTHTCTRARIHSLCAYLSMCSLTHARTGGRALHHCASLKTNAHAHTQDVGRGLLGNDQIKPYGILILFMSMAYIAESLDATGEERHGTTRGNGARR